MSKKITTLTELSSIIETNQYWFEIVDMSEVNEDDRNKRISEETMKEYFLGGQEHIIDIVDWDMDTNSSFNISISSTDIPSPLDITTVADCSVIVWNDSNTIAYKLEGSSLGGSTGESQGAIIIGSTTIYLSRVTGGIFDSASFSSTGNRGFVKINISNG